MPAVLSASHAARCVTCHGVRSHAEPVALVGECSVTLVHAFLALAPISQPTTTPEDVLREAGISSTRQTRYQRRVSSRLTGR